MIASKKIFGLIAAALVMGAVAGCGGGGENPPVNPVDNVPINGGIQTSEGQAENTIPASNDEQQVTLTINGQTVPNVTVAPTTQAIPPTTQLAVFPANVPIIQNLVLNGALNRAPGDIIINGEVIEGVSVDDQGRLTGPLAFGPGRYTAQIDGPWSIVSGNRRLDVGEFVVTFDVNANGNTSFPTNITGQLPTNGGSTLDGESFVSFAVHEDFGGFDARLRIEKSNGDLQRTIEMTGNTGTFRDLFAGGGNPVIPANGVTRVIFTYNP